MRERDLYLGRTARLREFLADGTRGQHQVQESLIKKWS
jgi:hypothetical protein